MRSARSREPEAPKRAVIMALLAGRALMGGFGGPQGAKDGFAHRGFWRAAAEPELPLRKPLGEEHLGTRYGRDALPLRQPQQLSALWPVNQVHHHTAIEFTCLKW